MGNVIETITVSRIRPVSWMIFVQGKEGAEYVCRMLEGMQMETTTPREMPGLVEPPLFAFTVSLKAESSFTTEEIEAILTRDERISLAF